MISLVFCTVYFACSLFQGGLLPDDIREQKPKQKPEQLLSAPVDFTGSYSTNRKDVKLVSGKALFSVSEIQSDNSVKGVLTISLSEQARKDIASLASKPVSNIPITLKVKDASFFLDKKSMCPVITLNPELHDIPFLGGTFRLEPFIISIDLGNNSKELSGAVCSWERLVKRRNGHAAQLGNYINRRLRGEKEE